MNETPVLRQLLICEKAIVEQHTEKVSLINCHTDRVVGRFPTPPLDFVVYGLLTDGFGTSRMQLIITRADTAEEILQATFPMHLNDRLQPLNLVIRLSERVFPAEGMYQIVVVANGEMLGLSTLTLRRSEP